MDKIEIERVTNGWILTYWDEYVDTGLPYQKKVVFNYDDNEKNALEKLQELLWEINEKIGIITSKHNKRNINIEIV